jgi:tRNA G18 (ribose-2'-O)-methylase SpoU
MLEIKSPDDERISYFFSLKGNAPRLVERNVILIEGEKQVRRLLETKHTLVTLFMEKRFYEVFASLLSHCNLGEVECFSAERQMMEKIVGYRLHQGVMALAERPAYVSLAEMSPPIVALNGVNDPENVGGIMRTCAACGVNSLLVDDLTTDPYHRRAIRVSMGAALSLNIMRVAKLSEAIAELGNRTAAVALENVENAVTFDAAKFPSQPLFVFGSEAFGVAPEVLRVCREVVRIPCNEAIVSSLNVSAAAAVVLTALYAARH